MSLHGEGLSRRGTERNAARVPPGALSRDADDTRNCRPDFKDFWKFSYSSSTT